MTSTVYLFNIELEGVFCVFHSCTVNFFLSNYLSSNAVVTVPAYFNDAQRQASVETTCLSCPFFFFADQPFSYFWKGIKLGLRKKIVSTMDSDSTRREGSECEYWKHSTIAMLNFNDKYTYCAKKLVRKANIRQ